MGLPFSSLFDETTSQDYAARPARLQTENC